MEPQHEMDGDASVWGRLFGKQDELDSLEWGGSALRFTLSEEACALISRQQVESWLTYGNLRYPQFSLSHGGEPVHPSSYTRPRIIGEHRHTGCADPHRVAAIIDQGATLSMTGIEMWDGRVAGLCAELGRTLAARVQAIAFLTPPDRYGSAPHRDAAHVFVVQAEGTKRWTLYDLPTGDDWTANDMPGEDTVTREIELRAGEGLYVPMGMGHRALAGSQGSLHLSVIVTTPRLTDVVQAWAAQVSAVFGGQERLRINREGRADAIREVLRRIREAPVDVEALVAAIEAGASIPDVAPSLPWPR
ncbi:JmjC domain-containing protein [Nonomuraea recticatena]